MSRRWRGAIAALAYVGPNSVRPRASDRSPLRRNPVKRGPSIAGRGGGGRGLAVNEEGWGRMGTHHRPRFSARTPALARRRGWGPGMGTDTTFPGFFAGKGGQTGADENPKAPSLPT